MHKVTTLVNHKKWEFLPLFTLQIYVYCPRNQKPDSKINYGLLVISYTAASACSGARILGHPKTRGYRKHSGQLGSF